MARKTRKSGSRLDKLKALSRILADKIDSADDKELSQLVRQYRETLKEIEEIEGAYSNDDEIADILKKREDNGDAGAVR